PGGQCASARQHQSVRELVQLFSYIEPAHGWCVCGGAQLPASARPVRAALWYPAGFPADAHPRLRRHFYLSALHCRRPPEDRSHNPAAWLLGGFTNPRTILPMDDGSDGCGICVVLLHLADVVVPGLTEFVESVQDDA